MNVRLEELQQNALRDFDVDPYDDEIIERLKLSIGRSGFWGGVACRRRADESIEIVAGHHRVRAALEAGIREADLFVADALDDVGALEMYGMENGTQRGNLGTARTGTVAAALRIAARAVMREELPALLERTAVVGEESPPPLEKIIASGGGDEDDDEPDDDEEEEQEEEEPQDQAEGYLVSQFGLGWSLLHRLLRRVPGVNSGTVQHDLKNLKKSGAYARIVGQVADQVAVERAEELEALRLQAEKAEEEARKAERDAQRAREAAKSQPDNLGALAEKQRTARVRRKKTRVAKVTRRKAELPEQGKQAAIKYNPREFDYRGVAHYLKNPHQVDIFREMILGPGLAPYVQVEEQKEIAAKLVALQQEEGLDELTAYFIRQHLYRVTTQLGKIERRLSDEDRAAMHQRNWESEFLYLQRCFWGALNGLTKYGERMASHLKNAEPGFTIRYTPGFWGALNRAKDVILTLNQEEIRHGYEAEGVDAEADGGGNGGAGVSGEWWERGEGAASTPARPSLAGAGRTE